MSARSTTSAARRNGRRRHMVSAATLTAMLALAGCGGGDEPSGGGGDAKDGAAAPKEETTKIRIAEVPRLLEMFLVHVADEEGFMEEEGVSLEYISVKSGPELVSSLLGGNADVALAAPLLYWPAINKGEPIVSLMGAVKLNYVLATCAPDVKTPNIDAPFPKNLQDLKGKRVGAIGPGTATEWFALELLEAAGLEPGKDVNIVYLGGPATAVPACQAGRADFYTFPPPTQGLLKGARPVADALQPSSGGIFDDIVVTTYATTEDYESKNAEATEGFCRAVVKAREFSRDPKNQDRIVELLAKETGISVDIAREVWPQQSEALGIALTPEIWEAQKVTMRPPLESYVPEYEKHVSEECTSITKEG